MGSTDFEREAQIISAELEREREKLRRRVEMAQQALEEIERSIGAMAAAVRAYREYHNIPQEEAGVDDALRERFKNLSTRDALIQIAEERGGVLEGKEACQILVRAGMCKDLRNASGSVYATFNRYPDLFQKVARGKYRLLRQTAKPATFSAAAPPDTPSVPFMEPRQPVKPATGAPPDAPSVPYMEPRQNGGAPNPADFMPQTKRDIPRRV
jgi:hypothetical protein